MCNMKWSRSLREGILLFTIFIFSIEISLELIKQIFHHPGICAIHREIVQKFRLFKPAENQLMKREENIPWNYGDNYSISLLFRFLLNIQHILIQIYFIITPASASCMLSNIIISLSSFRFNLFTKLNILKLLAVRLSKEILKN